MFDCSQENFPVLPCSLSVFLISVFPEKTAFVPMFPALFSFCSLVPNEFKAMFPCSLNPWGSFPITALQAATVLVAMVSGKK